MASSWMRNAARYEASPSRSLRARNQSRISSTVRNSNARCTCWLFSRFRACCLMSSVPCGVRVLPLLPIGLVNSSASSLDSIRDRLASLSSTPTLLSNLPATLAPTGSLCSRMSINNACSSLDSSTIGPSKTSFAFTSITMQSLHWSTSVVDTLNTTLPVIER